MTITVAAAVLVLAASSLTETLPAIARKWTAQGHARVEFSFDASSRLARQIEQGAPADAFVSADRGWMDELQAKGLVDPATRRDLAGNTLVAVLPAASPLRVTTAVEFASPAIRRLGLAAENVPAGRYARASLRWLGVWPQVAERVLTGDSVRTVLGWVASGEADAGVVYATDARIEPRVRTAFAFPHGSHPAIVYPAAVVQGATHREDAAAFLTYCQSTEARSIFAAAGFLPPSP
ncbi:MAG: molybdate ABC transporter substrate-binding protein [Myxococcales bacterium]|nr:molybdate ABC transporter substrate-binding protein [Myxococcales bacterium]